MTKAYYMDFIEGHNGSLDRVGGLPTHLPPYFPKSEYTGRELAFVMQVYSSKERFDFEDIQCIQIYQTLDIEEGDDGEPVLVVVPKGAKLNTNNEGVRHPDIGNYDIAWRQGAEPDLLEINPGYTEEEEKLFSSKIGGAIPPEFIDDDRIFLGQIMQELDEFNFGGKIILYINSQGDISLEIS